MTAHIARALCTCLLLLTLGAAAQASGEDVDKIFADFDAHGPGRVCVVMLEGKVLHTGFYGLADVEKGRPFTLQSQFDLASVSKQFTGLAAAMLLASGRSARPMTFAST